MPAHSHDPFRDAKVPMRGHVHARVDLVLVIDDGVGADLDDMLACEAVHVIAELEDTLLLNGAVALYCAARLPPEGRPCLRRLWRRSSPGGV